MKMKHTIAAVAGLLATTVAASAADLPVKARPVVPAAWSWTGLYVGAHVGAGWGTNETTLTGADFVVPAVPIAGAFPFTLPLAQTSASGFLGGVQAGYNWQSGWAVFGVQGDIAGTDIKGSSPCLIILSCRDKTNWLATVSGRLGAVVLDRGLVYVKGGGAWANINHSVHTPNFGLGTGIPDTIASKDVDHFGWMIGLGTEWAITQNWTAFVEYNYIEFEKTNQRFRLDLGPQINALATINVNADLVNKLSIAKVGVNYKFDWGTPVVAKY